MTHLDLTLTMLGDWHVGTGAGRHGMVDRSIQLDSDGLPFIPAKTLAGVWRDGCESVVYALDGGERGPWHAWLEYLFGSQPALERLGVIEETGTHRPRPAALFVDSLHYPQAVIAVLRNKPRLRQAATFLKPGVAIDAATGRAAEKMLRFEEMARGGAVLVGRAHLTGTTLSAEQQRCAVALLDAGARLVEGLGGKRRRGAGRCRFGIGTVATDWRWLRGRPTPPQVPTQDAVTVPPVLPETSQARDGWEIADLRMVLRRPLVAHERTVGNEVRSFTYVPGWMLLPAVLQRLDCPQAALAARTGELVVTNATVEVGGRPGRPAPLALARLKNDQAKHVNLMAEIPDEPVESFEGTYVGKYRPGRELPQGTCSLTELTHSTILDEQQRPVEAVGGLYTYQAIAVGTVLRAQVRVPAGLLEPGWQEQLSGMWRVGRARKDGYGLSEVTATSAVPPPVARPLPEGRLRVWLMSDVLVTDERLRPSSDPVHLAGELGRALGVQLRPSSEAGSGSRVVRASEPRRMDPWHRRWGLPRASLLGMRAGSCLTFDLVSGTLTPQAVQRVELAGVGLRRAEGFGQLRIADPLLYSVLGDTTTSPASVGLPASDGAEPALDAAEREEHSEVLRVLEQAAWRAELHHTCEAIARDRREDVLGSGYENVPPSQLGSLRMLVTHLTHPGEPRARTWLQRLKAMRGVELRGPWPPAAVRCVEDLLTTPGRVWELLALPEDGLVARTDRTRQLRERLWAEAVRTLVEDCLTAHSRATGQREGA
ncbi:RAMP superfamily CRISPR-associated protein [Streptomyces sp900105755]|uniref:RAMP superfamily CRISPR-associated protein n=1 Tax=Streptomyces sp. 900105755 TaxID=3154389 RepID=A0ABV1TWN7_9ACTN